MRPKIGQLLSQAQGNGDGKCSTAVVIFRVTGFSFFLLTGGEESGKANENWHTNTRVSI